MDIARKNIHAFSCANTACGLVSRREKNFELAVGLCGNGVCGAGGSEF